MFDWAAHVNDDVHNVGTRRGTGTYKLSELVPEMMKDQQAWNEALNDPRVTDADSFYGYFTSWVGSMFEPFPD
ncbi:MAG: hypothetical protein IJ087_07300 [Eggerthellaceae bacterium]|nr:hypothetical protein [Eggerthellaceae bacterium]